VLGPSDIAAVRRLLDERRDHYIVCGLLWRLVMMGAKITLYLEVNYLSFFNLEVKYLVFVYFEVKCWTFLFLFYISCFEVKYPHARD
jgi:hypothetical protein